MTLANMLRRTVAVALAATLAAASPASACTGIRLKAADGGVVTGRTLEFGFLIPTDIVAIPRGQTLASDTPIGPGLSWTSKYAAVGASLKGSASYTSKMREGERVGEVARVRWRELVGGIGHASTIAGRPEHNKDEGGRVLGRTTQRLPARTRRARFVLLVQIHLAAIDPSCGQGHRVVGNLSRM